MRPHNDQLQEIGRLLARGRVVRDACDLDLLVFLFRHPRTLLSSEQLAFLVGYDIQRIAKSLDAFMECGLLERIQNPMHAARLYVLTLDGLQEDGINGLLTLGSTREGRRKILECLKAERSPAEASPEPNAANRRAVRRLRIRRQRRGEGRYA